MEDERDRGDTLIEIIITIMIVSLAVTALIASLATAARSSSAYSDNVLTDTVLRNYAEAAKAAVELCSPAPPVPPPTWSIDATVPDGFSVSSETEDSLPDPRLPDEYFCPDVNTTQTLTLRAVGPAGVEKSITIKVRTP